MATNQALALGVALSVLSVLTVKDLFPSDAATEVQGQSSPADYAKRNYGAPVIQFLYW